MSESKSKFSVPAKFPASTRVRTSDLRALSTALVGAVFNAEIARLVVDANDPASLSLFRLTLVEFNLLPPANVHPDRIGDATLRAQVLADAGWYRRYEDQYHVDYTSEKEVKTWLLAVLPVDVFNKCVTAAGGEGRELRPAYTVRTMLPLLLSALADQRPTELRAVKAGMEQPFEPHTDTLESWLTAKTRLAALATEHLDYTFNDSDVLLSVWTGLAHLHLATVNTFKQAWTTTNRLPAERTFERLSAAILVWERDMMESEQPVFEPTRLSAGFRATAVPLVNTTTATADVQALMSSPQITGLTAEDSALLKRFIDAGLATIAHKKANPSFVVPPHACVTHGICYHSAADCKSKPK
jgi:hypothetical protein